MARYTGIGWGVIPVVAAALSLLVSCNKLADATDSSKTKILASFRQQGIYERNNIPEDTNPNSIKGYYDIIGGAYRYITNENRDGRADAQEISAGDSVSFYFDARIFVSSYDNSKTYFTNSYSRIKYLGNNNPEFDASGWSSDSLRIKVGSDPEILKSVQNVLPGCRVGDEVRIYLPPNVAYGSKSNGVVPGKSTLIFELTSLRMLDYELDEAAKASRTAITDYLTANGIFRRYNVPEGTPEASIAGYYDIVGGAYRWITNESRADRADLPAIRAGNDISFYFDSRIFTGNFDNAATWSTNIADRIDYLAVNNPGIDTSGWSTAPLKIRVGSDTRILNSVQNALASCRPGDIVRIFLPPDLAYGNKQTGLVPAKSTLAYELTNIEITE